MLLREHTIVTFGNQLELLSPSGETDFLKAQTWLKNLPPQMPSHSGQIVFWKKKNFGFSSKVERLISIYLVAFWKIYKV